MTILGRRAALGAAIGVALPPAARAQEAGAIRIAAPWTRAMRAGGTGAGFMVIRNTGTAPDRIVSARSPVARVVELHTHIRDGDVMRMRPVPAIDLPAGQEVRLQPGGLHIMLIGLTASLERGGKVRLTLVLERAGEVTVELAIEAAGARGPGQAHGQGHGHRH
jgi:copper(I)-binding protein